MVMVTLLPKYDEIENSTNVVYDCVNLILKRNGLKPLDEIFPSGAPKNLFKETVSVVKLAEDINKLFKKHSIALTAKADENLAIYECAYFTDRIYSGFDMLIKYSSRQGNFKSERTYWSLVKAYDTVDEQISVLVPAMSKKTQEKYLRIGTRINNATANPGYGAITFCLA